MAEISYKNLTRIKNVTNAEQADGGSAYLDLTTREFVLHWPNRFQGNILSAGVNEILAIYQTLHNTRYYTHLVQPLDEEQVEHVVAPNFRFGRRVKVIAYAGHDGKIPFEQAYIYVPNSFGTALKIEDRLGPTELEGFQRRLWSLFEPFMDLSLRDNSNEREMFQNDDLERDFETPEGKLLFALHRRRERDSTISVQKKEIARTNGDLSCEVCDFSFHLVYGEQYIECHHRIPIHKGERITRLQDLALVCSNCHRMLHRKIDGDYLSVETLRERVRARR